MTPSAFLSETVKVWRLRGRVMWARDRVEVRANGHIQIVDNDEEDIWTILGPYHPVRRSRERDNLVRLVFGLRDDR